jgi:hypothetical protein
MLIRRGFWAGGRVEAFLRNAEHATADGAFLAEVDNHETPSST